VKKFTLVGHDWGGAIAWGGGLMGQALGRVERLIIMNAPHPAIFQRLLYTDPVQRAASQYMRAFRDPANDVLVQEHGLGALLMKALNWSVSPALEEAEKARMMQEWLNREAAFGMLNWYRATPIMVPPADAPFEIPDGTQLPELPKLTIPTLVIWALDDMALPPVNLDGMENVAEDLTLVKIPDCGHFVPWEAPDKVNAALDEFLAKTAG
jgi:pimeloyl-ACP methyl ester carboxylesterase